RADVAEARDGEYLGMQLRRQSFVGEGRPAPRALVEHRRLVLATAPEQRHRQLRDLHAVARLMGPLPRGAQVLEVEGAFRTEGVVVGRRRAFALEPREMPRADRRDLTGLDEPVEGIEADCLEQSIAPLGRVERDERFVDERAQYIDDLRTREVVAGADAFRSFDREAVDEDGQPAKEHTFARGEELEAPVERCGERLLPLPRSARPPREQSEPVVESTGDLWRREMAYAGGRQLERERDAVEAPADLDDARGDGGRER